MIAHLSGKLETKQLQSIVIENAGIGYQLSVPFSTSKTLPSTGKEVRLFCHLHWREDGPELFGFATETERQLFRLLTKVNKVGPRLALSIMSSTDPESFAHMILSEEVAKIKSLKGVGPKLASRLILELKEPVAKLAISAQLKPTETETEKCLPFEDEITQALENLGYSAKEIKGAFKLVQKNITPEASIEDVMEAVLKYFSP